jgi:DNA-directed RNA polymerase specialized sigma24 family protein
MARPDIPLDIPSWFAQYGDRLLRFVWSYVQDPQVAEDLVANVSACESQSRSRERHHY